MSRGWSPRRCLASGDVDDGDRRQEALVDLAAARRSVHQGHQNALHARPSGSRWPSGRAASPRRSPSETRPSRGRMLPKTRTRRIGWVIVPSEEERQLCRGDLEVALQNRQEGRQSRSSAAGEMDVDVLEARLRQADVAEVRALSRAAARTRSRRPPAGQRTGGAVRGRPRLQSRPVRARATPGGRRKARRERLAARAATGRGSAPPGSERLERRRRVEASGSRPWSMIASRSQSRSASSM